MNEFRKRDLVSNIFCFQVPSQLSFPRLKLVIGVFFSEPPLGMTVIWHSADLSSTFILQSDVRVLIANREDFRLAIPVVEFPLFANKRVAIANRKDVTNYVSKWEFYMILKGGPLCYTNRFYGDILTLDRFFFDQRILVMPKRPWWVCFINFYKIFHISLDLTFIWHT